MQPLRLSWLWITGGVCLVTGVAALALAPAPALPSARLGDRAEHALAFLALMLWFAGIAVRARWWVVGGALFAFGAGIELLQGALGLGRVPDAVDAAANSAGILAGLAAARAGLGGWMRWVEARVLSERD